MQKYNEAVEYGLFIMKSLINWNIRVKGSNNLLILAILYGVNLQLYSSISGALLMS